MSTRHKKSWAFSLGFMALVLFVVDGYAASNSSRPDDTPEAKLQQMFIQAGKAYDEGAPAEAVRQYSQFLDEGYLSKEILFNLANAHFKAGASGAAMLNYRRAWYLAPRDPDILANLRFVSQAAGIPLPTNSFSRALLMRFSLSEWIVFSVVVYWSGTLILAVFLLLKRAKSSVLHRAGLLSAVLLVIGFLGIATWAGYFRNPELVIQQSGQEALFAPLDGSTAHFKLPEGSIVRAEEYSGGWIKIRQGKESGWIKQSACKAVYPWKS